MTPSACLLSTGTSLTAAVPNRMTSSASEGPGLVEHVTKATCGWRRPAPGPQPSFPVGVSQPTDQSCSQSGERKKRLFFNPAFSLRTERCLEYLFSDFWFISEAAFVSGTSTIITSFLPSPKQALLCCVCQDGDQSISYPFSLRTRIFLEAALKEVGAFISMTFGA